MRSLLNFLLRFKTLILFLILEAVALLMISSTHNYHQSAFYNIARSISGTVSTRIENGRAYFRLRQVNEQLIAENRLLHQRLENAESVNRDGADTFPDTSLNRTYNFLAATVVNNSVNKQKNYITLNKGRQNGVTPGMAVIGADGIVGVVIGVSQNFCVAMSVLNLDFRLSASMAHNDYFGSLAWNGKNYRYAQLAEIPHHVAVNQGDTIVTSGYSAVFPAGIMIGTIDGEPKKGGDFITLSIKLSADLKNITHVYIIGNNQKEERINLEKRVME